MLCLQGGRSDFANSMREVCAGCRYLEGSAIIATRIHCADACLLVLQTVLHEVGSVGLLQLLDAAAADMDTWQRKCRSHLPLRLTSASCAAHGSATKLSWLAASMDNAGAGTPFAHSIRVFAKNPFPCPAVLQWMDTMFGCGAS